MLLACARWRRVSNEVPFRWQASLGSLLELQELLTIPKYNANDKQYTVGKSLQEKDSLNMGIL